MERLDTGWVCLQVTGWHACPGPTLPSHLCIHRWHGCDRTARRAHRLRSACGRISPQSCSCRSQEGRHRRCQFCYHTFRKRTDMLREKEKGPSGLGDKLSSGHMGHRGSPPSSTPISLLLSGQTWWLSLGRLWEHLCPCARKAFREKSSTSVLLCTSACAVQWKGECDERKRPRSSIFTYFLLESLV